MRLDIATAVRYPDGAQAGTINKVVYDPQAQTVREIVLETSDLLGRLVLVPLTLLHEDPGAVLTFDGDADALDALPTYEVERFMDPSPGWEPDPNYVPGDVLFPTTSAIEMAPVFEQSNIPEGTIELSQGTQVVCTDGPAGIVDEVLIDDAVGRVTGLVLRPDAAEAPLLLIPVGLIRDADPQVVQLNCTLAELATRASRYDAQPAEPESESLAPSS